MTDKLRDDVRRGEQAKALLDNEVLKETFRYLEHSYTEAWKACKTTELREEAWHAIRNLQRLEEHLVTVLNNGKLAQRQIQEMVRRAA